MATVTKDFKVKSGLVVEGATATVNNYDVLTKKQEDQNYIVDLIGGTATPENTPNTVVKRDGNGNFVANQITASLVGNVEGNVTGDVTGTVSSLANHDTDDLAEGSNLYFTNQRAIDAQAGLWDEAGSAQDALNSANNYTNGEVSSAVSQAQTYADSLASNYDPAGAAYDAQIAAAQYADGLAVNYDAAGAAATAKSEAIADANSYTDTAVSNLVDSAPAMLDTLNELAAAIADNPNYASDVTNLVATKADTTYVDDQDSYYNGLAQGYATTAQNNANDYADQVAGTAEDNANSYTNTAINNLNLSTTYDAYGAAAGAEEAANLYTDNSINALTTDAIEEGEDNLYFTNSRVENAIIDPLTLGTQTNISVTYNTGTGAYDFVAENGIADSTTSDLVEGSNLYFTDARAVSALEAVVPNFTEIDLNNIVTNVATQATVATASQVTAHEFDSAVYRSAEYTVKVAYGSHTELSKVMLTLDSADNIAITEYAVVGTNGSASTITADVNAGSVRLRVTTANNNSVVTVFGTIVK